MALLIENNFLFKVIGFIVIRYKVYSEQHTRAGTNIQHVIYDQLARAGQNTKPKKVGEVNYKC